MTEPQLEAVLAVAKQLVVTAIWQQSHLDTQRGTAEVRGVVTVEQLRAFQDAMRGDQ